MRKLEWTVDMDEVLMDNVDRGVLMKDLKKGVGAGKTECEKRVKELGLWEEYAEKREARKAGKFDPYETTDNYNRLVF